MLTFEQIKELIDLVCERELQGLEIERSGFRVKISGRDATPSPTAIVQTVPQSSSPPAIAPTRQADAASIVPGQIAAVSEVDTAEQAGLHILNSPIVGTFYASPNPDAEPYISVGDRVKRGQVLCIVEAMKLMNEIESDVDGVVDKIFTKNAQPVEFGEPLFAIHTD